MGDREVLQSRGYDCRCSQDEEKTKNHRCQIKYSPRWATVKVDALELGGQHKNRISWYSRMSSSYSLLRKHGVAETLKQSLDECVLMRRYHVSKHLILGSHS